MVGRRLRIGYCISSVYDLNDDSEDPNGNFSVIMHYVYESLPKERQSVTFYRNWVSIEFHILKV